MASGDFDIAALHAALDAQRRARGLSWARAAREVNGRFADAPRAISASTISGLAARRVVEGDGALQMLIWLDRTPESFTPGAGEGEALPIVESGLLRFDTQAMFAALDARRRARGLSWEAVAGEVGAVAAASLTRLAEGGRTSFPQVMRLARWLGRSAASLTRRSSW